MMHPLVLAPHYYLTIFMTISLAVFGGLLAAAVAWLLLSNGQGFSSTPAASTPPSRPTTPDSAFLDQLSTRDASAVTQEAINRVRTAAASNLTDALLIAESLDPLDSVRALLALEPRAAPVLDAIGDACARALRHADALAFHEAALEAWRAQVGQAGKVVAAEVAIASDLSHLYKYEEAIDRLHKVRAVEGLPPSAHAVLLRMESSIYECKGDYVSALRTFEETLGPSLDTDTARLHVDLLKRFLELIGSRMPTQPRLAMQRRVAELEQALVRTGPWERPSQLPRTFIKGLRAREFHDLADYPAHLQLMTVALREEYRSLKRGGLLVPEQECIHDNSGGDWTRFEITGNWVERDETGCSVDAPVACDLMRRLRAAGLPVLRMGYSALGPNTWLKPHFGMTNGQLKFHLGLVVPRGSDGAPCALLRVGGSTQAWTEGGVLFFDDSFEHSVQCRCTSERVVLQVVFVHPDIAIAAKDVPTLADGH